MVSNKLKKMIFCMAIAGGCMLVSLPKQQHFREASSRILKERGTEKKRQWERKLCQGSIR